MSLDDFKEALKKEIGSVATVFTKAGIDQKIKHLKLLLKALKKKVLKLLISR